jgi:uncharacterized membrane protein YecN with MAPEG domain
MLTHQTVFALYAALNGFILLYLGLRVSLVRRATKTSILDGGKDEMIKAVRAHGNAAEHIPIVLLLLVALAFLKAPMWLMHIVGITLTAGRVLHAIGLYSSLGVTSARLLGASLTSLSLLIASVAALVYAFI